MENYKLILLMINSSIGGLTFAQVFIDGDTVKETFTEKGFLAGLFAVFIFLVFTIFGIFGIVIYFALVFIFEGFKRVFQYLEIGTILDWYVFKKRDLLEKMTDKSDYSKEHWLVFLNLTVQKLLNGKKLTMRFKGKIYIRIIQKINKQEGFVPRADNDYRCFLRGGNIHETPETPFDGIVRCCGISFDVNAK